MSHYAVKQSQTARPLLFLMIDSADHISGKTGLSPTVTISKNGGSFASPSGAVSEVANGWYKVAGNATDTNTLGPLLLHATAAGADPTDAIYDVVAQDPDNALVTANVTQISGDTTAADNAESFFDGAGYAGGTTKLQVDVVAISGDTTAADNAEALFDNSGFNASASTIGTASAIAAGGITAASIATGAIDADALATDAVNEIVDQVWDEALAGHLSPGSTGEALSDAGAGSSPTAIADEVLKRDWESVSGEASHSLLNAARAIRNRISQSGTTVFVYKEDETTVAWQGTVDTDPDAVPIVGFTPS